MTNLFELALAYSKAGISVIPVSSNEAMCPNTPQDLPFDCDEYVHERIATPEKLREWFSAGSKHRLAAVLGPISGGLECLDLFYLAAVKLFRELVTFQGGLGLLERLPTIHNRVNGGIRLYYRCSKAVLGNRRLAQFELPSEPGVTRLQVLAMVQGEGCWSVLPGTPDFDHGSDSVAQWLGQDLSDVPTLSEDERQLLLESASCLNAWADPNVLLAPEAPEGFDSRVNWEQILVPSGWKKVKDFGEVAVWHSPERVKPGYCAVSGIGFDRNLFYEIRTGRAYTKFGAFGSFYFGGDFEKARSVRLRPSVPSRWESPQGRQYLGAVKKTQPLVSCLTPTTGDRRHFLPLAIRCFQRQTYPNLELLILCDGEDDMSDIVPRDDQRIRYDYLGRDRRTLGIKLNLGCERAKGDLIAHMDDDDWSHPDRLSFQVGALLSEDAEFCGLPSILFYIIASGEVWLSQTPALLHPSLWHVLPAGNTFLYRREFWSRSPFPDLRLGPDMAFIAAEDRQDHAVMVCDYRLHVGMIHGCNTDDYSDRSSSYWSRWQGDLREIMGADLDFYRSLQQS